MGAIIEFADKLRNQIDIVDVIGAYVELRRGGINLKGLCPFHREKTPSFTVNPSKQMFHCFGCSEGGDVIKFVQKAERLEWIEAVRFLSEKYKIPMPELRGGGTNSKESDIKDRLLALSKLAADRFAARLSKAAQDADHEITRYLARREIPLELTTRFGLGLAADGWTDFTDAARKAGYENETLVASGIVIYNAESQRYYDRFRNRLVFTVSDQFGRPIAFGARVYASDASPTDPKYINSPETPLYHKGQHLYALHLAKDTIVREKKALVMEGYMDVMRAHQHGFTAAVATCGTALTDEQARSLKKYCNEVVFVYDGDEAGQKAMLRGCEILLDHEFAVSVVVLPGDHDPDSFLQKEGAEAFAEQVARARGFFSFFLDTASARHNRSTPDGKVQIVEFLLPLLKRIRNPIARDEYVRKAAEFLVVDATLIQRQLSDKNPRTLERLKQEVESQNSAAGSPLEKMLLRIAVESPAARNKLAAKIQCEWLRDTRIRKWFGFVAGLDSQDKAVWDEIFAVCDSDDESKFLRAIAVQSDEDEPLDESDRAIDHTASRLKVNFLHEQNRILAQQIHEFFGREDGESEDNIGILTKNFDLASQHKKQAGNQYFLTRPSRKVD